MNVNDLRQSRFLTQKEVDPPVLVTIQGCKQENVAMEGADPEYRWTLTFDRLEKPMTLNITNGQIIAAIIGSEESTDWIGHKIVLYKDPNIFFGGKRVGGIRCRAPESPAPPLRHQTEPDGLDPAKLAREESELAQKITNPDNPPTKNV